MKHGWMIGCLLGITLLGDTSSWASVNENEQEQDQSQRQVQAAVAIQDQSQDQAQEQSSTQGNDQSLTQTTQGQGRNLVQSSPVLLLGNAQEGLSVGTPWGNASLGKQSEVTQVVACGSFIAANGQHLDSRVQGLADQCVKAAKRCGLLCHIGRLLF